MKTKEISEVQRNNIDCIFSDLVREIKFILDKNNIILYISDNVVNILGFLPNEMIGKNIFDFIEADQNIFNFDLQYVNDEMYFVHKNDSKLCMQLQIKVIDHENKIPEKYGTMIDISKYKNIEHREENLKVVLDNAKDIIYTFEILPKPKFVYISSAIEEVLGYEVQEYYDDYMLIFNTAHPEDVPILYGKMNNELDYTKPIVSRWIHKKGHCVWVEDYINPTYDDDGNLIAFEGVCRDISERIFLEKKLNYLTYHDTLTGLKNRTFYDKQIEELNTFKNLPVGVIVCDLDNLKIINDKIGHHKGDEIIKSASSLLLEIENENISISRIGGDEFVVLVKNTNELQVIELYQKINSFIKSYNKDNDKWPIELSIGYAFGENSVGNMTKIFKRADKNMYGDKLGKKMNLDTKVKVKY